MYLYPHVLMLEPSQRHKVYLCRKGVCMAAQAPFRNMTYKILLNRTSQIQAMWEKDVL